jgi:hypothetical protein
MKITAVNCPTLIRCALEMVMDQGMNSDMAPTEIELDLFGDDTEELVLASEVRLSKVEEDDLLTLCCGDEEEWAGIYEKYDLTQEDGEIISEIFMGIGG